MGKLIKILFLLVVAGLVYAAVRVGPAAYTAYRNGLLEPAKERKYDGNSRDNLKAIYTAMMLYHDSEEKFPNAKGWMDAVEPRLLAGDMKKEESEKRLVNPDVARAAGEYGYAMNPALSGKYKADLKDPKHTILVFESGETRRNAYGDPKVEAKKNPGKRFAITVSGELITLK